MQKFIISEYQELTIDNIELIEEECELYDIEVEDDHTFCITENNIISHNCNNMMKALTIPALQTDTAMIVLNHVYDDPSAMYASKIKNSGGGKGLQYMGSIILQCTRNLEKDEDKNSEAYYGGTNLKFFTVKNRMARPSLECDVYLDFKKGFTKQLSALFDEAVRGGFITCPSQGYYCVPSSSEPEKKRRRSEIENNVELWKTFLKEFDEWSQKDLQYSKLETIDLDNEEVQENLDMLIDENENAEKIKLIL